MLLLFLWSKSQMALIPTLFQTPSFWWTHAEIPFFWAFIVLTTSAHMCSSQIFVKISESRVSEWSEYVELSIQKRQNLTVCICGQGMKMTFTHSLFHTDESLFDQGCRSLVTWAIKNRIGFNHECLKETSPEALTKNFYEDPYQKQRSAIPVCSSVRLYFSSTIIFLFIIFSFKISICILNDHIFFIIICFTWGIS